ncbi:PhzF family phenazine biosynthesis protein [Anaerotardibacter muris]|uniref:PhzF family phenazine biosynthesis protein n=1 Tax=Anaerotardibacter muris TaxID=2941505 RepID=UPI00203AD813|nr:PhzF family phenazine biosynthesis protein [Anaerotardibacter muris]
MSIQQYMIDAFAPNPFEGNQAAVCVTAQPLSVELMQDIAIENNFSETAFIVPLDLDGKEVRLSLRWFTPGGEIDLCGHATLASGFAVNRFVAPDADTIVFETCSGDLIVKPTGDLISMDMPAYAPVQVEVTDAMEQAFGIRPEEAWLARDLICVLPSEEAVLEMKPDKNDLLELDGLLQVVTARATQDGRFDCVSRCFAPKLDVYEDPVTGSSHCALAPIWATKLAKDTITAFQASKRSGILTCRVEGDRVIVSGPATLYAQAELFV